MNTFQFNYMYVVALALEVKLCMAPDLLYNYVKLRVLAVPNLSQPPAIPAADFRSY